MEILKEIAQGLLVITLVAGIAFGATAVAVDNISSGNSGHATENSSAPTAPENEQGLTYNEVRSFVENNPAPERVNSNPVTYIRTFENTIEHLEEENIPYHLEDERAGNGKRKIRSDDKLHWTITNPPEPEYWYGIFDVIGVNTADWLQKQAENCGFHASYAKLFFGHSENFDSRVEVAFDTADRGLVLAEPPIPADNISADFWSNFSVGDEYLGGTVTKIRLVWPDGEEKVLT